MARRATGRRRNVFWKEPRGRCADDVKVFSGPERDIEAVLAIDANARNGKRIASAYVC
jgi:hypothetical protein